MAQAERVILADADSILKLGWWNTALSPNKALNRGDGDHRTEAINVINNLLNVELLDFIALTEVSETDVSMINSKIDTSKYTVSSSMTTFGRAVFNMAFIIRNSKVKIAFEAIDVTDPYDATLRAAKHLHCIAFDRIHFHILASHWPGRRFVPQGDDVRIELAALLKRKIGLLNDEFETPLIVLMGDYNDEPYDTPLRKTLKASRCPIRTSKAQVPLYNPFWNVMSHFCESEKYTHGTYYYRGGKTERWITFDQIMVSSSFFSNPYLTIDHKCANVYANSDLVNSVLDSKSHFDHLPIFISVQRTQ